MLYVNCVFDLFTDAADGISLKDIRHVCTTHNSWENVAAGSTGNAGNPGPAGFANDPQAISYQPQILDGSTNILDWTGRNQTVNSANIPIQATGCPDTFQGPVSLAVPGSTGNNTWWAGMPVRVSTTGTATGGLTAGQLYWVYNCGSVGTGGVNTSTVALMTTPMPGASGNGALKVSQGSGTTTFTNVFWHPKFESWYDLDTTTDENWATRGSTARFTRRIYPALTNAEKTYWEETGLVIPMYLGQPTPTVGINYNQELTPLYNPFSKGIIWGTSGTGARPDIGPITEFSAQAFVNGTENNYYLSRLYTTGALVHGMSTLLDEATGRIPVLNNGPPTGPGGNGVGGSYGSGTNSAMALGSPQTKTSWNRGSPPQGFAPPLQGVPNNLVDWSLGVVQGTTLDHIPNFVSLNYLIFGERIFLDATYFDAERDLMQREIGPGDGWRDDVRGGNHYWGLTLVCCESRGSAWALRDQTFAAALGGDGNIERSYFADQITENLNYYPQWLAYKEGPGVTNIETSILPPNFVGSWSAVDTFIGNYMFLAAYDMQTFLHAPVLSLWITPFQRFYEGACGEQLAGHLSAYYCIDYSYSPAIHNGDGPGYGGGSIGSYINGTDASDFGNFAPYTSILAGGLLQQGPYYTLTTGDTVKNINRWWNNGGTGLDVDELIGTNWYTVIGPIDNTAGTYHIQCPPSHPVTTTCPTPGAAFTGFTRNGKPITAFPDTGNAIIYRINPVTGYNPSTGYADPNYISYAGEVMNGLTILGRDVPNARRIFAARSGPSYYGSGAPSQWWDPTVVVP